ncbi:hypothetical protein NLI96_g5866 [Meripilus lineatus]|uniref:Uncharacterized protein n=1 Tax=Meripilus lineatus TaxID=2056292 RepID=A0AAD5YGJ5_9APHY|nr:hypothetical protein NLI96_g5866 [Physisporinus lineatus]
MSLDVLLAGLQAAQAVVSGSPILGLDLAINIAVSLLQALRSTKHITSECKFLAQHAAQLTLGMYLQLSSANFHPVDSQIILIIDEHASTLREIEAFMTKVAKRSFVKRIVFNGKMKDDLERYRGKLDAASRLFGVLLLAPEVQYRPPLRQSIIHPPKIDASPPKPSPQQPRATLKKSERKPSQSEIKHPPPTSPKPSPTRKLSRERVRSKQSSSTPPRGSIPWISPIPTSSFDPTPSTIPQPRRARSSHSMEVDRKLRKDTSTAIQHSRSQSDILGPRRVLTAINEFEKTAFSPLPPSYCM